MGEEWEGDFVSPLDECNFPFNRSKNEIKSDIDSSWLCSINISRCLIQDVIIFTLAF